jgi:lipopolysaccharide/colanic/teichoic acid biosynthesis glycosyltransferase
LLNVLRGDMSVVGPRPPIPYEVENYELWHRKRLDMKPGITGLWQVSGRNRLSFDEMVRLDLFYIENWSLWLDAKIILKTLPVMLKGEDAY